MHLSAEEDHIPIQNYGHPQSRIMSPISNEMNTGK